VSSRECLSQVLTDRCTVAAYVVVNTTISGRNYTTSRDVTNGAEERLDMGSLHFRTQTRSYAPPASHRVARRVDVQCRRPDRPVRGIVLERSY
jgi:hypothetical protein